MRSKSIISEEFSHTENICGREVDIYIIKPRWVETRCSNCLHTKCLVGDEPCHSCSSYDNWEPQK